MHYASHRFIVAALSVALVPCFAQPAQARNSRLRAIEHISPDIPRTALQRQLSRHALRSTTAHSSTFAVTDDQVGDSDSFGRTVNWLGVTSAFIDLDTSCGPTDPDTRCQVLQPAPLLTSFHFNDAARIELPAKATHSLLCYWFSPVLMLEYDNPTAANATARLTYTPTLTVENPVLNDPALIDPTTGVAFGGQLTTSMTASEIIETPLAPGAHLTERSRDSDVCMAGFLSRRTLTETFGLTDAQADAFFKQPTMVRLNVAGSSRFVSYAQLIFGLRIVGD